MPLISAAAPSTRPSAEDKPRLERDRYGRPLIVPPDGGEPMPYTRASSLGKALDDETGLIKWKQRMTAIGVAARRDLILAVNAHRDDKSVMGELVEKAMDAAESGAAATSGTALHELMDAYDKGRQPYMPEEYRADVAAYLEATSHLEFVRSETFVVDDELHVAGTYDNLFRTKWDLTTPTGEVVPEGTLLIADKKTGQEIKFGHTAWAVQLSTYAHGLRYDIESGTRLAPEPISKAWGLVIHVPVMSGQADVYWIDLRVGRELGHLSVKVREARKTKTMKPANLGPPIEWRIAHAATRAELHAIRSWAGSDWTAEQSELANARWRELTRNP
jgi:hypothetical protein